MKRCPIAFVLLTHQHTAHLERLCDRLSRVPDARIFLHHDFSQSELPREVMDRYRLSVVQPSRRTSWARASAMLAELDAFQLAYDRMPEAEWFVLLSGSCYPIKPFEAMASHLAECGRDGYVDINRLQRGTGQLHEWWHQRIYTRKLVTLPSLDRRGRFRWRDVRAPRWSSKFPEQFHFCFGSQWLMLRRPAVGYLIQQGLHNHPVMQWLERAERSDRCVNSPEETFIQTVLGNSKGFDFSGDNHWYIDWENSSRGHPNTLGMRHWEAICASQALFARKFAAGESDALLERIDREILQVEPWALERTH
jgi:hypothetical protein